MTFRQLFDSASDTAAAPIPSALPLPAGTAHRKQPCELSSAHQVE